MQPLPARITLARLPTPIDQLPDLSRELGVELYLKRDDMTGGALSGNKVRKLEYELAAALERDADVVITCGGAQSNHCRATAIAARSAGLEVELFLRGAAEAEPTGNLFLDLLVGAGIHAITPTEYADRDALMARRAEEIAADGRTAHVIPEGASSALGSLGYVHCMEEIVREQRESGTEFDLLISAVGSGGTLAGLLAGARVHGFSGRVLGVPVADDGATFRPRVEALLAEMQELWFPDHELTCPPDVFLDGHTGLGYGEATDEELERLRDLAILTGVILDPVYTNKAFGGLLALVRDGIVAPGDRVLFLHTGGIFGLFPHAGRITGLTG